MTNSINKPPRGLVVLGMHRSGTSIVTRLISLMGAWVGEEKLVANPAPDNPRGFWENLQVKKVNDWLLGELNGSWDLPPANLSRIPASLRGTFRQKAAEIITEYELHGLWVMKDPRLCLTLPLWLDLLGKPIFVHVYRPPTEVALSLSTRDHLPLCQGISLWELYNRHALEATAEQPRILFDLPKFRKDPHGVILKLYQGLQAAGACGLSLPHKAEVEEFVDLNILHFSEHPQASSAMLNASQRKLVRAFESASVLQNRNAKTASDSTRRILASQRYAREMGMYAAAAVETSSLLNQVMALEQAVARQTEETWAVRSHLNEMNQFLKDQSREHAASLRGLERQMAESREHAASLRGLERQLDELGRQRRHDADRIHAIYGSMSWRITAPLRAVYGGLRGTHSLAHKTLDARRIFGGWLPLLRQTFKVIRNKGLSGLGTDINSYYDYHPTSNSGAYPPTRFGKTPLTRSTGQPQFTKAVLCLPIIDWDFRFQRPQQLMRQFARDGQPVLYVSLQFSDALTTREVETNITELCLPAPRGLNPYRHLPDGRTVSGMLDALENYLQEHHAGPLTVIVQLPFWRDLAMQIVERRGAVLVYDCMDDHAGFSTNEPAMLEAETRLIEKSDLVIASSRLLQQKAEPQAHRSALIRNACEYNLFAEVEPAAKPIGGQIVVGYYGAIADWFDSDLVCEIAKRRPDWRFQLIGSTYTGDVSRLETLDNVSLLGEQPYGDLPKLIGPWHVCIIPFRILALTEATNPVKVYEMLAAGKPVVSTPLPELQTMAKEGVVALADTAAEFVRQIEAQVKEGRDLSARGRAYAAGNTWEMRYQKLAKELLDLEPLVSIVIVTFHNLELNRLCLASVLNDTSYSRIEVIVVDNASEDGTPEYLKELELSDSRVRVILNDENEGFAAANNQGMAVARGQYLCLLNNDTVVSGDWLTNLVAHCKRQSKLGMVGPVTNAIGNEAKIEVGYEELADMGPWARQYTSTHAGSLEDISMLAMFCVVIPRYVWRRVGLLDERFVSGMFEDDDYNRRVRHAGYQVRLARDSFVHHWQRSSFKLLGEDEYLRIYHENQEKYDAKWAEHPPQNFAQEATLHSLQEKAAEATGTVIFAPSIGWNIHLFQRPHHFARLFARMGYLVIFDCSNAPDQVDLLNEVEPDLFLFRGEPDQLRGLPRTILWTFSYNYDYRDSFSGDVNVLYDWIDDLSVFPYEQEKLARLHDRGLREADLVASVAQRLHKQALEQRPDAIYLPNAVEEGRFERAPEPNPARNDRDLEGFLTTEARVAGYYGALAEWFDYELLCRVAEARPDWRFLLVGPDHDGSIGRSRTGSIANIRWIGPRDYQALPGYLHLFDVAMIPFQINDITLATSPLKLFEYFAGGRPVISTPMPECAAFDEVIVASTPEGFAEALDEAVALAEQPDYGKRLEQVTALNTWRARAESVIVALSALSGEDSGRGNLQPAGSPSIRPGSPVARAGVQDSRPQVFKGDKYLAGRCNICGNETRFFFEDPAEYRESLVCEHCRSTSRYRSIASGLLKAVSVLRGVESPSIAELPKSGVAECLTILDTQIPFWYERCAYSIPELLSELDWINLHLSKFAPHRVLGEELSSGVENQNLEQLTYPDETFDILITSDVMEHVRLDDRAHSEIARVLKPGGVYLFTVPHFRDRVDTFVRVEVSDPEDPSRDRFLTEPEYHADANSLDGYGALSYRSYGTEIDDQLKALGFAVDYSKSDDSEVGRMNTELFYCQKKGV